MLAAAVASMLLQPGALVSSTLSGDVPKSVVQTAVSRQFASTPTPVRVSSGFSLYRVEYASEDFDGTSVTSSGLICLPDSKETRGLVVYCHGTMTDRRSCPSAMGSTGRESPEVWTAALALGSGGYAVCIPDYLGLGASTGAHPYAQRLNWLSCRDIVRAARTFGSSKGFSFANRLFVTGYSEGGGVAMWATRKFEESGDPSLRVAASVPMSGPYDLSRTMARHAVKRWRTPIDTAVKSFFMSYFAYGLTRTDPVASTDLEKLFVPSYASYITTAFERGGSMMDVAKRLANKGLQVGGLIGMERILQPDARIALRDTDRRHWVVQRLAEEDCYDWTPTAPMYLIGLKQDGIVPYANTEVAIESMRRRGVGKNRLHSRMIDTRGLDHVSAMAPCIALARLFLDKGFGAVPKDAN